MTHALVMALACVTAAAEPVTLQIGGTGGVYFLASPGELTIDLVKQDLNRRSRHTDLRAILVGPDRRVLQEVTLPDQGPQAAGGPGPRQQARLATQVRRKGVYALNVTVSQDRYGDEIAWGFRTNCPHYLIETARGHRDERHQEPIVLLNRERPSDICFLPRGGAFTMDVERLPKGIQALQVYDDTDALIRTMKVGADGRVSCTFPAAKERGRRPWRLHLPIGEAVVHIDGVTRWNGDDRHPNLCCWTPVLSSFFPLLSYHWLLTPYHRTLYGKPSEPGEVTFELYNSSQQRQTFELNLEFSGEPWSAELSASRVALNPRESRSVTVRFTFPNRGETGECFLRATPEDASGFSTYATLQLKTGAAPATEPLEMPLVLTPYAHENRQFGYVRDYPVDYQLYFDLRNRPVARTAQGTATWQGNAWQQTSLATAVASGVSRSDLRSWGLTSTKIAFDRDNDQYVLASSGRKAALLHSADGGKSCVAYLFPGGDDRPGVFDIEQFSGHNTPDGPPPVVRYTRTAQDARLRWRKINDLELFLPTKRDGRLVLGEPILISRRCIGLSAHSGIPSTVVSRGSKVHIAWAEATEPEDDVPGVPTFVVTCDRSTRQLGEPVLVGHGPPANDIHNTPSITMDGEGYLHVLAGTHGQPFPYARSLQSNDAHGGWTEARPTTGGVRQTYIGLVCGPDGTLHAVFRMWRQGVDPSPHSIHATLAYQRKRPGRPWETPRVLLVSAFSEYSVFYHRLTIDRSGGLFLSYDYWSTYWFYRNDRRGSRRAMIMSPDDGDSWKLVQADDF